MTDSLQVADGDRDAPHGSAAAAERDNLAAALPELALSRGSLDRQGSRRADPALVSSLLADPGTKVAAIRADRMALHGSDLSLRAPEPLDAQRSSFFLGVEGEAAYLGVVEDEPAPQGWQTLRQCGLGLTDRDAGIFTTLLSLANWHATHRFCGRCGSPTEAVQAGWVRRCPVDASEHFPRTDPAVIVSVIDEQGRLLLGRATAWPQGQYSVLAGFVEPGESFEATVVREVFEESGVRVTDVRLLGDQPWPFPSSIMIGCTARAVTTELTPDPEEMAEVRWVSRGEYAQLLRSGTIRVPGGISIAKRLIERWLGDTVERVAGGPVAEGWRTR